MTQNPAKIQDFTQEYKNTGVLNAKPIKINL